MTQNAFAARVALDSERIDVRGRAITVTLPAPYGTITAYHLFIVYTDKHAQQFVCQGFPFDPATGQVPSDSVLSSDPAGLLTLGHCINFLPSNRDFIPDAPSITVASGKEAHKAYECFAEKTDLFNSAEVPYHVITGQIAIHIREPCWTLAGFRPKSQVLRQSHLDGIFQFLCNNWSIDGDPRSKKKMRYCFLYSFPSSSGACPHGCSFGDLSRKRNSNCSEIYC